MKKPASVTGHQQSGTDPSAKRRDAIFDALRRCVIEKGFANTTLADIARTAGMSPSHLLYYFSDKGDILAQYFEHVARRITERLGEFRLEEPLRRVDLLAHLFFGGKGISKSEIGLMLECFGVAVHSTVLRRYKMELDRTCKAYLRELFEAFIGEVPAAANNAEVAYANLVGLRTAVYFDEDLTLEHAHEIFRNEVLKMVLPRPEERRARGVAVPAVP